MIDTIFGPKAKENEEIRGQLKMPDIKRGLAVALVAVGKEHDTSLGIRLLSDLRIVFDTADAIPTKMITRRLAELDEAPWGDIKGKPLDDRGLAKRLKEDGIRSKTCVSAVKLRGHARVDLHDAWARYLPQATAIALPPLPVPHRGR